MKKKFTFLMAALMLLAMVFQPGRVWGQTRTNFVINTNNFTKTGSGTGYAAYNGEHEIDEITIVSSQVMPATGSDSGKLQFQTNKGCLYNTDEMPGYITKITLSTTTNFTIYVGTSEQPNSTTVSSGSTISGSYTYFQIKGGASTPKTASITVEYTPTHTLTYSATNGSISGVVYGTSTAVASGASVAEGGKVTLTATPAQGYSFSSWEYSPTGTGAPTLVAEGNTATFTMGTANATVTANFVSAGYTVTFDCDGGDGCPDDVTGIEQGANNFTVPSTTPTKPCYAFDGVYLDGELNEYEPGETYTITGDLELTASWTLNKYNITYQAGEGSGSNYVDANQNCGSSYTIKAPATVSITAPAAKPYFTGWLGSDDNTYQTGDTYEVSAALTLTAQWTATAVYDVLYDCNGGTANCPSDASYEENTTIQLPAAPTYADHTFNGWLCSADLETYAAGADYTITEDVEFDAQWLENLAAPTITVEGVSTGAANTYYATAAITITAASGATIYYTTDGTNPTMGSTVYSASFNVTTTGENTVKAIAVKAGNGNSSVSSSTFTIVQPNEATFTNGVYSSLANASSSDFNTWYAYDKTGSQSWSWSSYSGDYFAKMSGYVSSTNYANEDWLVSPKMLVENGKLKLSFKCATKKGDANTITIKYSTDYPGYGDPTGYTWTNITTTPTIDPNNNYTFTEYTGYITGLSNNTNVYVAFKYTSTTTTAGTVEINTFSAKQCYPVIYHANGGSGTTTDADSPYAVGTEVTVVDNTFIAPTEPANMEFDHWNTQDDDKGIKYYPDSSFPMGTTAVNLYAIWAEACTITPTMAATTNANAYVNDSGTKSWTITFTSKATALGGCDIYDYGFVYSSTVSDPDELKIGEDDCIKESVGISYPTANTDFNYAKTGVDAGATIYVRSYAINAAGTAYGAVATVTTAAFPTYTISYSTNGHDETSTTIYQGDVISGLINPTTSYIPAGYTFMGWYNGDYASVNTAPSYVKNGDAISGNLELKAVFAVASTDEETVDASLEIIPSDFTTGGYAANDGDHEKSDITYNTSNVYQQSSSNIQFKSNSGYLYNKTSLNLTSIALSNISQGAFTVYAGTEEHPTTTSISGQNNVYTISDNSYKYFTIKGGSNTPRVGTITVNYTTTASVTTYSNYCTSVTSVTMTEDVTIAGDLNLTYTLTVPSGKTLTVTGDLVNNNVNRLVIEDGGQLILSSSQTGDKAVAATFKKSTTASEEATEVSKGEAKNYWYAISSPVSDLEISSFVPGAPTSEKWNVYRYDEPTRYWNEYRSTDSYPSFSTLTSGVGYLYRSTVAGIEFKGDVNVGDATYKLKYTNKGDNMNGFNLIGNPFSYNIYKGVEIPNDDLEPNFYVLEANGGWTLSYDHGTSDPAGPTAITPNTAILVQAQDDANDKNLTISKSSKGGDYKYGNDQISFRVENSEYSDIACVLFREGHGLNKISHRNAEIPMLYVTKEGENFASANMPDNTSVINLGFEAKTIGQYTFSLKAEGTYSYMHLYDKLTGNDVDMLVEDSYTFIGAPSDRKDRFVLNLNYNAGPSTGSETFAYQSGNDIMVSGEGELQVFDVMGRMVMSQRINGVETVNGLNNGVYIFRMEGKTQKIVVR